MQRNEQEGVPTVALPLPGQHGSALGQQQQQGPPLQAQQAMTTILQVIDQIAIEDRKGVFRSPVDGVRGYYEKISNPMCFEQMREKLRGQRYFTFRAFQADLELIFENAK